MIVALATLSSPVLAECENQWLLGDGVPGVSNLVGVYENVNDVQTWDPDGDGPEPEVLVVGGEFEVAGSVITKHLAIWNGSDWLAFPVEIGGTVHSIAIYDGSLVVARNVVEGLGKVVRWSGKSWDPIGIETEPNSTILAMHVFQGELIVGGFFNAVDGTPAFGVASWDGDTWRPLHNGLGRGSPDRIMSLGEYQGQLIAGGLFTNSGESVVKNIARWDGAAWLPLGSGLDSRVDALAVHDGQLIATGYFLNAGNTPVQYIARWNGNTWQQIGQGLSSRATALAVIDQELWVGGYFETAGEIAAKGIARWDGMQWHDVGGTGNTTINIIYSHDGEIIVGGTFGTLGGVAASSIGRWDGNQWQALSGGMNRPVRAMTIHDGDLVIGGAFRSVAGIAAQGIARRSGGVWHGLGSGVDGEVRSLKSHNGDLIAGGAFLTAGGKVVNNVARWDGKDWHPMAGGLSGYSTNGVVFVLAEYDGRLLAGGQFIFPGEENASFLAQWDGEEWNAFAPGLDGAVLALSIYQDDLVAGGQFLHAGKVMAESVARWDGTQWHSMGVGLKGVPYIGGVYDLQPYKGDLIAAGAFGDSFDYPEPVGVARWDGQTWNAMGNAIGSDGYPGPHLQTLEVFQGMLFAAGRFALNSERPHHIAFWNGKAWQAAGAGTNAAILALQVYDGKLFVGGSFVVAGSEVSAHLGQWGSSRALGDHSGDSIVDAVDMVHLPVCTAGPDSFDNSNVSAECLCAFNSDGDGDVDLKDIAGVLSRFAPP